MAGSSEDLTQLWMVPYADLMSMMVLLFMALFGYSYSMKTPEYQRALAGIEKDMSSGAGRSAAQDRFDEAEMAVRLKEELGRLGLRDFGVEVTSTRVRLTLPSPVLFAEGSASLAPEAGAVLEPLARLLAAEPNPVLVEGHTDSVPIAGGRYRSNWELSAARAFSVIEFLLARGMDASRFHARGYGEHRPAAGNDTPEGRARNRRIEISLVREVRPS